MTSDGRNGKIANFSGFFWDSANVLVTDTNSICHIIIFSLAYTLDSYQYPTISWDNGNINPNRAQDSKINASFTSLIYDQGFEKAGYITLKFKKVYRWMKIFILFIFYKKKIPLCSQIQTCWFEFRKGSYAVVLFTLCEVYR